MSEDPTRHKSTRPTGEPGALLELAAQLKREEGLR